MDVISVIAIAIAVIAALALFIKLQSHAQNGDPSQRRASLATADRLIHAVCPSCTNTARRRTLFGVLILFHFIALTLSVPHHQSSY